mmetsp:Transcript_83153/g.169518  ORF Transcript_83153/g.169518 Transcript_83153/m.169518 type:complete len:85 (+) Transcript_83153:640-894(+)
MDDSAMLPPPPPPSREHQHQHYQGLHKYGQALEGAALELGTPASERSPQAMPVVSGALAEDVSSAWAAAKKCVRRVLRRMYACT